MSEPREPLLDAIRAAGEVPPPPDRDAAFARAMQPVFMPSRRRLSRSVIALFAAAMLAAPAAVLAAHESRAPVVATPIVSERPDPGTPIHSETDDATLKRQIEGSGGTEHGADSTEGHGGTATDDHSATGTSSPTDDSSGSSGTGDGATVSPTPTITESSGSNSGPDGGSTSGSTSGATLGGSSDGGSLGGSSDGGTSGSN